MRVETTVDADGITHKHYIADPGETVVMTGPIQGLVTLDDGTKVNVNDPFVVVADQAQADELADKIGQHWAENGHPDDVENDDETGELVQRDFVYVAPTVDAPTDTSKES